MSTAEKMSHGGGDITIVSFIKLNTKLTQLRVIELRYYKHNYPTVSMVII